MSQVSITPEYEGIATWLREQVPEKERFVIAVDGVEYVGKSSLSRFLSWQLGVSLVETDLLLLQSKGAPRHDSEAVGRLVEVRKGMNRPVIVEGVFTLECLHNISVNPDLLIRVSRRGATRTGSWPNDFASYRERFPRALAPDYSFVW